MKSKAVLVALVAVAGLAPFQHPADQDRSRWCLTRAFLHAQLQVGSCIEGSIDRSRYQGRLYSNKAPGMSIAAIPAYALASAVGGDHDNKLPGGRWVWLLRLSTSGVAFLAATALIGRLAARLVPAEASPTIVAFALATPVLAFAATAYDHVPATALLIGAFAAAWNRSPLLAGAAAGAAVLVEYQSTVTWAILLVYVGLQGWPRAARYVAGSLPFLATLAAYDWAGFGAPWHTPLTYSDNRYQGAERSGVLGLHAPTLHGAHLVFVGQKGLLVTAPLILAAGAGLVPFWRRHRNEAAVCVAVATAYLVAECGYFDPYNGFSPGPRYAVPAFAFLALGLPFAFARRPRTTWALVGLSAVASIAVALTWALGSDAYQGSIWTQLWHLAVHGGRARLTEFGAPIVLPIPHAARVDAVVVVAAAAAAVGLAYRVPSATSHVAGTPRRRKFQSETIVAQDTSV